jgi:hypothetical protein
LKDAPKTGTGDLLISVQAVEPIRIPLIESVDNIYYKNALEELVNKNNYVTENGINNKIFDDYNLSLDERKYIIENFS